jgi:predicted DCC family thiol-disulfide oxidoreductase YuxK
MNTTGAGRPAAINPTLVYDGRCPLCQGTVTLLRRWRRPRALDLVPAETPAGRLLLEPRGLTPEDLASVVLIQDREVWQGSDAVWRAATRLRWPYRALAQIRWCPRFLREAVYGLIARNRPRA